MTWKASKVPDTLFLRYVDYVERTNRSWCNWGDLEPRIPVPRKILLAKAERLLGRGLMSGCACGCRGGFELTRAGRELIQ